MRHSHRQSHHQAPDNSVVLPSGARVSPICDTLLQSHRGMITSQTKVRTFAAKYRIAFVLDSSPSMVVIDPVSGEVVLDQVLAAFEKTLYSLISSIGIPGTTPLQYKPQIFVSVLAQGSSPDSFRVLLHGAFVTEKNIASHVAHVSKGFRLLENALSAQQSSSRGFGDPSLFQPTDMGSLLQNATVALKLLPHDACPGVILITDGTNVLPENSHAYDSLIMLMNREDISCSVIQVGTMKFAPNSTLGLVTDSDTLQHLANSAFGVLLTKDEVFESSAGAPPAPGSVDLRCSALQFDLLSRSISGPAATAPVSSTTTSPNGSVAPRARHVTSDPRSTVALEQLTADEFIVWDIDKLRGAMANDYPFPWRGTPPPQALFSVMVRQYSISSIPYGQLMDCRSREGFHLQSVSVQDEFVIVKLILPWKTHIKALYTLKASTKSAASEVSVTIDLLAFYDFIQQFTVSQRSSMMHSSSREMSAGMSLNGQQPLAARLQHLLGQISETDRLLSHLFTNSLHALRPLWEPLSLPGGAGSSSIAKPHAEKHFWKVLTGMTRNAWHRWFRAERVELVLTPDGSLDTDVIDFRRIQHHQPHHATHPHSATVPISAVGLVTPGAIPSPSISSGSSQSTSDTTELSSGGSQGGGSLSSHSESLRLKFRHSLKDLIKYFTKWATLSHSRHTFARIINYQDPKLAGTASWSHSRPPAFCIVRLSWDATNLCILNTFFFGVSADERLRIIFDLRSDLASMHTPDGKNAFSLCQKPLRLVAIRYNQASQNTQAATPALSRTSSTPSLVSSSSVSNLLIPDSSLLDDEDDLEDGPQIQPSRLSLQQPLPSASPLRPASTAAAPESPLSVASKMVPSFGLLKQFLSHKRWIWNLGAAGPSLTSTQRAIADAFVKTRIREGWNLVQMSPDVHLFFREVELQPFSQFVRI